MPRFFSVSAAIPALLAVALPCFAADPAGAPAAAGEGVKITQSGDNVRVDINGQLFTEYWFKGNQHPALLVKNGVTNRVPTKHVYFWPLIGPGGVRMTRAFPITNDVAETDPHEHEHHRGLWFSHGKVNGIDFWGEESKAGRIVHDQFLETKSGPDEGVIKSTCKWVAPDGKVVCTDERTVRFYNRPASERLFDFEVTIKAPQDRDVLFGDTKEGSMAVRINEQMRVTHGKNTPGTGHIVLSTGIRDDEPAKKGDTKTWGKRADWCDYYGAIDGKKVGIAIFDHPSNPVHPTPWHVRDYGLFAANPFGIHDFERKEPGAGNMTIPAGKSVTFRYRFYLHEGDEKSARVAERYAEYVKGKS